MISIGDENNAFFNPVSDVVHRLGEIEDKSTCEEFKTGIQSARVTLDLLIVHSALMTKDRAHAILSTVSTSIICLSQRQPSDFSAEQLEQLLTQMKAAHAALIDVEEHPNTKTGEIYRNMGPTE